MDFTSRYSDRRAGIVALFRAAFAASEGAEEGALVAALADALIGTTPPADLVVFSALDNGALAGCIMFSRLDYEAESRRVLLLSPVAVAPAWQGKGVGQALLRHGLAEVAARGVDVAITYGDPGYYARVGFHPITPREAAPLLELSHPEGWLGQSLGGEAFRPLRGPSRCVAALDDPVYW